MESHGKSWRPFSKPMESFSKTMETQPNRSQNSWNHFRKGMQPRTETHETNGIAGPKPMAPRMDGLEACEGRTHGASPESQPRAR